MASGASYHYRPLEPANGEIRLLSQTDVVETSKTQLNCSMSQFSVSQSPAYKAISYAWGENLSPRIPIILDGYELYVTIGVDEALRAVWSHEPETYLWIDALCINQDDVKEKNQQVPRMRDIFQGADSVIVWLGPATFDSSRVIQFLKMNQDAILLQDATLASQENRVRIWRPLVQDLLSRPWWKRLWVIQEVAVARKVDILCGSDWLPWGFLSTKYVANDHRSVRIEGEMYTDLNRAIEIRNVRFVYQRSQSATALDWKELLIRTRAAKATLPVDKIYGLLGLANAGLSDLRVDYNAPIAEVFKQFTRLLIVQDQRLDFICMSGDRNCLLGLPTWTPNLGANFRARSFNKMRIPSRFRVQFDANGTAGDDGLLQDDLNIQFGFSPDGNVLCMDGLVLDEISAVSETSPDVDEIWADMQFLYVKKALDIMPEAFQNPESQYVLGGSKFDALKITLVADTNPEKKRITEGRYLVRTGLETTIEGYKEHKPMKTQNTITKLITETDPVIMSWANRNRRFFTTIKGYIGLAPQQSQTGDMVCTIFGCDVPVVLRKLDNHHIFIGESYVHGMMFGFAVEEWKRGKLLRQKFVVQ